MRLIVGLGNPGPQFEGTRHNIGFWVVDRLAATFGASFEKKDEFKALIARSSEKDCLLVKPLTYMNLAGLAVAALVSFYKIKPEDVWVTYDDVDLPVGTARVRAKGLGRTKHKGLLSIAASLGTHGFPRFRIGIAGMKQTGRKGERPLRPVDLKDFVLQPFDKRELPQVQKATDWVVEEILTALKRNQAISHTLTKGV